MAKLAVFCSSSDQVSPLFLSQAAVFGGRLAKAGHTLVYGGANCGMMGEVARGALQAGGEVVGVIPDLDFLQGLNQVGLTQQVIVKTLAERKAIMLNQVDGAVALPGGLGTLDEVFDALVLKVAKQWDKPFWFYNFMDFWEPLLETLSLMAEQRIITQPLDELYMVTDKEDEIFNQLGKL